MLADHLDERFAEIEEAVLARVYAVSTDAKDFPPEYEVGLLGAVAAAIGYAVAALRASDGQLPPVPEFLTRQARIARHSSLRPENVLLRYAAGRSVLDGFLLTALPQLSCVRTTEFSTVLSPVSLGFERVIAVVGKELQPPERQPAGAHGLLSRITRLLAGEPMTTRDLRYNFDGYHVGVVAEGATAQQILGQASHALEAQMLAVQVAPDLAWLWIGSGSAGIRDRLAPVLRARSDTDLSLGLGEEESGLLGWRRTHEQARIAFAHAPTEPTRQVRYCDVAVRHAVQCDPVLSAALHSLYVAPLEHDVDSGLRLRDTLAAYFAAGRNRASAASLLGVSRRTVGNRLAKAEDRIGRPLSDVALECELALAALGVSACADRPQPLLRI